MRKPLLILILSVASLVTLGQQKTYIQVANKNSQFTSSIAKGQHIYLDDSLAISNIWYVADSTFKVTDSMATIFRSGKYTRIAGTEVTISANTVNINGGGGGGGSGTVTSIGTTSPLTGGTITTSGTIAINTDTLSSWRTKQNKGSVAWGWGNHASSGYMSNPMGGPGQMIYSDGNNQPSQLSNGNALEVLKLIYNGSYNQPQWCADTGRIAWGWGDHALQGYLKSDALTPYQTTANMTTSTTTNATKYPNFAAVKSYVDSVAALLKRYADVIPLFAFGIDSTAINTTNKFTIGYSNGIVIDSLIYVCTTTASGGTVNVTPKIFYGPDISATGTATVTSPSAITTRTYATRRSTFDNATIGKGNIIWLTFTSTTTIPKNFFVQIIGHKQ